MTGALLSRQLWYDRKRYEEAIREWESSVDKDGSFAIPWRNLGIGYFNVRKEPERALSAYEKAFHANPADARLLYELDQLRKRMEFLRPSDLRFSSVMPIWFPVETT